MSVKDINGKPIKIGDKVKRVRASNQLIEGAIYTVIDIKQRSEGIKLKEYATDGYWDSFKFEIMGSSKDHHPSWF